MEKVWKVNIDGRGKTDGEIIDEILEARGIEDVHHFLNPTEDDLVPFEKMRNIDQAAQVILDGVENGKKFFVHWDSDQDGVAAGSIATRWLQHRGADVSGTINQGKAHGISNLDLSLLDGVDILWIVDSIESRIEPYEAVTDLNIEVVITDHHLVSMELQEEMVDNGHIHLVSSAVGYPNEHLCGAATTWKLCSYMDWLDLDDYADDNLVDLACVGTIADMSSVGLDSPENRYICSQGFAKQTNPAIKKINGSYNFDSQAISFGIATLTNAANRTSNNEKAMQLFMSDDTKEISSLIKTLKQCKEDQNLEIADIMPNLEQQAESQMDKKVMYFFVDTENSVSGLIANKLMEKYSRPVIVLSDYIEVDEETGEVLKHEYRGSARAIGVENFKRYVDCIPCGWAAGHPNAHGIGINTKDFRQFQEFLEDMLQDVTFVQETFVDVQLDEEQINENLIRSIKALNKISGNGFPSINVMASNIKDYTVSHLSGGKHLKIDTPHLTIIKWNCSDEIELGRELSVVGTLDLSWFARRLTKQIIISDYKYED